MRVDDAVAAANAGADFIGIMFGESRRRVSREAASEIVRAIGTPLRDMEYDEPPPLHPGRFPTVEAWFTHGAEALDRLLARKRPLVVGVFKDQDIEDVNEIADETGIDLIQLSGDAVGMAFKQAGGLLAQPAPGGRRAFAANQTGGQRQMLFGVIPIDHLLTVIEVMAD